MQRRYDNRRGRGSRSHSEKNEGLTLSRSAPPEGRRRPALRHGLRTAAESPIAGDIDRIGRDFARRIGARQGAPPLASPRRAARRRFRRQAHDVPPARSAGGAVPRKLRRERRVPPAPGRTRGQATASPPAPDHAMPRGDARRELGALTSRMRARTTAHSLEEDALRRRSAAVPLAAAASAAAARRQARGQDVTSPHGLAARRCST